jgi:hypothetical protein
MKATLADLKIEHDDKFEQAEKDHAEKKAQLQEQWAAEQQMKEQDLEMANDNIAKLEGDLAFAREEEESNANCLAGIKVRNMPGKKRRAMPIVWRGLR